MVEFRIPAAEFLSAAVIVICFVIAVVMINMQAMGRARTFGVLGVALLFASMIIAALNGSLGSAYGTGSLVYGVGAVLVAATAAGGLILLALAVIRADKARTRTGDR
ncbi:hypothetical protein [Microlunatus soli]|nr:hypothetical protein [Microlunatus soli]